MSTVAGSGRPVLIVLGGRSAVGKSSVAEALCRAERLPYLRVDRIEQSIVDVTSLRHPIGPVGYAVGYALAAEQLRLGLSVVVECVNPLAITRDAWAGVAAESGAGLIEVELVCSEPDEHRRRVEQRTSDVPGLTKPSWSEVTGREYEPWLRPHLVIDTARTGVSDAVDVLRAALRHS